LAERPGKLIRIPDFKVERRIWHNGRVTITHPLRAVIFDYGKVLSLPPTAQDWQNLATATDLPLETLQHRYWQFRDDYDRKVVPAAQYWADVAGRELSENELTELISLDDVQWTRVNDDMLHLARQLKEAGIRIAILSNMQTDMLKVMRAKFDWLPEFDVQMYSCENGLVKPDTNSYLECARRLGVEPAHALFLDDKKKNVIGAQNIGMHAMLFDGAVIDVEKKLNELGVSVEQ
jgi:putative hydrolase of the HAD superfamily